MSRLRVRIGFGHFILLCAIFAVSSCSEVQKKMEVVELPDTQPFIINLEHYFSDDELNLSFPMWYNDSLILKNGIQSITRKTFIPTSEEEVEANQSLKEVKKYVFNDKGELKEFFIDHYYENFYVVGTSFTFSEKDEFGFSEVTMSKTELKSQSEIQNQYTILEKLKYSQKYLVYDNSGDYYFYMMHEDNWGTLSVDSILNPMEEDIIVLGKPGKPVKRYQVENTVNEFNVVDWTYTKGTKELRSIKFEKYPFSYKRAISYDKNGECTGFVDSTFSDNRYLKRRVSKFDFADGLPVKIVHENKSNKTDVIYRQEEILEYVFKEEE